MSDRLNRQQIRRLNKEFQQLQELEKNGGGYRCHFNDEDMSTFYMTIIGPENTPYEGGTFLIKFEIDADYPATAPLVTFETPVLHPNIATCGTVCYELLNNKPNGKYDSNVTLTNIVLSMQVLLSSPNPEDPMNFDAAVMLKYYPEDYDLFVRDLVKKHAAAEDDLIGDDQQSTNNTITVSNQDRDDELWPHIFDSIGYPIEPPVGVLVDINVVLAAIGPLDGINEENEEDVEG